MSTIKRFLLILLVLLASVLFAHTPLLLVEDNGDGTLYAEAGFSDGSGAQGMACKLEDEDGNILWEGKFDDFSSVECEIPDVSKYYVVFDAGPGHIVKKDGPVKADMRNEVQEGNDEPVVEKSAIKPVKKGQPFQQTIAQTGSYHTNPGSYYPVREYASDKSDSAQLKTHMTLITIFLGLIGLCLIFIAVTLIILVSKK